jgi:hypothetical protein
MNHAGFIGRGPGRRRGRRPRCATVGAHPWPVSASFYQRGWCRLTWMLTILLTRAALSLRRLGRLLPARRFSHSGSVPFACHYAGIQGTLRAARDRETRREPSTYPCFRAAPKLTARGRLVASPVRPAVVPQRNAATPPPRPAIQPSCVPPFRARQSISLRLREVGTTRAIFQKVRQRLQHQPIARPTSCVAKASATANTNSAESLQARGPRFQSLTTAVVCSCSTTPSPSPTFQTDRFIGFG